MHLFQWNGRWNAERPKPNAGAGSGWNDLLEQTPCPPLERSTPSLGMERWNAAHAGKATAQFMIVAAPKQWKLGWYPKRWAVSISFGLPMDFDEKEVPMGGIGSGRRSEAGCTDEVCRLDIRKLRREHAFAPGKRLDLVWRRGERTRCELELHVDELHCEAQAKFWRAGSWKSVDYVVGVTWIACNFGGSRPLWTCPVPRCGAQAAVLYGLGVFTCRRCAQVQYRSQREDFGDRAFRRLGKIRARLEWPPGLLMGPGGKPRGMHWSTFRALSAQHDAAAATALGRWEDRMGSASDSLKRLAEGMC